MSESLYIHIPFCLKKCIYCDFISGIYDAEQAVIYIEALKKEISHVPGKTPLSTLFIGGGTPTALRQDTLSNLLEHTFKLFNFNDNYEASIEGNPGTLDSGKLQAVRSSGINRISIGVQSFNNKELSFLGRIHSSEEAEQAVHMARDGGFENIGIDLIYGIPGQSLDSWKRTLERAAGLGPKHISTYELTVEEGTGLYKLLHPGQSSQPLPLRSRNIELPEEDTIIEMYEYAIDFLTSTGFIHYEISNFARPEYECRHNMNYWNRGEYYGAGLGAHSFINAKRFYNTGNIDEYLTLVSENKRPVKDSENITEDMALSEAIFLGLRKTEGLIVESISKQYRKNFLSMYRNEIQALQKSGLIELGNSGCSYETAIKLTRKGLTLSNEVFEKFIQYS
jgi:oxygen-independent coproporphyrinogen-3 oxidase